jgi:hypothetical protein
MHTASSATALAVLQEGSALSASRQLERELSTVTDACKWFDWEPANVWHGALMATCRPH